MQGLASGRSGMCADDGQDHRRELSTAAFDNAWLRWTCSRRDAHAKGTRFISLHLTNDHLSIAALFSIQCYLSNKLAIFPLIEINVFLISIVRLLIVLD